VASTRITAIAIALGLAASAGAQPQADLVMRNGAVYTMDAARSWAETIAVRAGVIIFVGGEAGVEPFIGPRTRVVSLQGKMVLPGFHDSHVHPVTGGMELGQCNLNGIANVQAVLEAIGTCATDHPDDAWIIGGGWDLPLFTKANPTRQALDRVAPGRAIYLTAADGHSAWVSTRGIELVGIDATTADPPNGRIERDATGAPSGTLRESAMDLVAESLPAPSRDDYVRGLARALEMANRFGITSLIEADADPPIVDAYRQLSREGRLTARVRLSLSTDRLRDASQVDELVETARAIHEPLLRADAVKIFADGVIEAQTAALLEPYVGFDHAGTLNFDPEALEQLVVRIDREGLQVHVHAIGDRAIRASLDALEAARARNGVRDSRHQMAHIQLFDPADIPRFRELGVVANFQPLWAYADSYITELTVPVLGPERSRWLYPIRSLVASGAVVVAGSDWSVSSMNPLDAIEVAITRRPVGDSESSSFLPEERVDLPTMLAAYTINGAYAHDEERRTGSIEIGKAADLIVLDRNLFEVPEAEIHGVNVLWTLLEGREVFRNEGFEP
jgi:predicted amidohydrolase YtcJ